MKTVTLSAKLLSFYTSSSGRAITVRSFCLRLLHCCVCLLAALPLAGSPAQAAGIKAGDIVVLDSLAGTSGLGALFLVDPTTADHTIISDFGNPAQGPLSVLASVRAVAVGQTGQIFVADLFSGTSQNGALFEVDPTTGNRTLVSDFGEGDIRGNADYGLAVDASGQVLLHLQTDHPAIVRVDPETGARVLVSELSNGAQGRTAGYILDLTLDHRSGNIFVTDADPVGAILQVDPETGQRQLVSDFGNPAQGADVLNVVFNDGLAVEGSGQLLVNSGCCNVSGPVPRSLLTRIDPTTGNRTVLSDFDNPAQGALGFTPWGIGVEKSGEIILAAGDPVTSSLSGTLLFRVNPTTGERSRLNGQGPEFAGITYIAVVPEACAGDCEGSALVKVNDLITLVNIALGNAQPSSCANGIPIGATVDIALVIRAVNDDLTGCG